MNILKFFKFIFKLFDQSDKKVHLAAFFAYGSVIFLFDRYVEQVDNETINIFIGSLSILTTFFLIAVQRINFSNVIKKLSAQRSTFSILKRKKITLPEGIMIKNTIFSLLIVNVILIFSIYFIYLFVQVLTIYALLISITYLFLSFVLVVVLWSLDI